MTKPITLKQLVIGEGIPKICVPLVSETKEEILRDAEAAVKAKADLVEWRADFFEALSDIEKTKETLREIVDILGQLPVIFTIRTREEGGNCQISTEDYVNWNLSVARSRLADLIDVQVFGREEEKSALIRQIQETGTPVIGSSHDFEKTDSREMLLKRFQKLDASGADILKMAVMPKEADDVAAIMQVTSAMGREHTQKPLIAMAMGPKGAVSRISGESFGSCITFGALRKTSAPGQLPVEDLRRILLALHEKNEK